MKFHSLRTEQANSRTNRIDQCNSLEIASLINQEDSFITEQIKLELPSIAKLINAGVTAMRADGRIFYVGTGSSGRLGVLDASEIPPTFHVSNHQFIGLIAGGVEALYQSKPEAEDDEQLGAALLEPYNISSQDLVIGISASGSSPFVQAALQFATSKGATTGCICCNQTSALGKIASIAIEIETGPEVILGSTRMKAGTAQKMVLNMFSTGVMIQLGKVYKNYMIDFSTNNKKLYQRAIRIIAEIASVDEDEAKKYLQQTNGQVKEAIAAAVSKATLEDIHIALQKHHGVLSKALQELQS